MNENELAYCSILFDPVSHGIAGFFCTCMCIYVSYMLSDGL